MKQALVHFFWEDSVLAQRKILIFNLVVISQAWKLAFVLTQIWLVNGIFYMAGLAHIGWIGVVETKGFQPSTLSDGGGWKTPPSHTFVITRKKVKGKLPIFLLIFLNRSMEVWGLLFAVGLYLVWSGGGRSGQTCLNFIRGDPVGSRRRGKWLTKIGD